MANLDTAELQRSPAPKSPGAFRTIREVSDDLDVPQHVLRFWETKFTQIRPLKRGGGRRYYRPEDVELLRRIRGLLYSDGYTIRGVQKLLRESGGKMPERNVRIPRPEAPPPAPPRQRPAVQVSAADGTIGAAARARLEGLMRELESLRDMLHGRRPT